MPPGRSAGTSGRDYRPGNSRKVASSSVSRERPGRFPVAADHRLHQLRVPGVTVRRVRIAEIQQLDECGQALAQDAGLCAAFRSSTGPGVPRPLVPCR